MNRSYFATPAALLAALLLAACGQTGPLTLPAAKAQLNQANPAQIAPVLDSAQPAETPSSKPAP